MREKHKNMRLQLCNGTGGMGDFSAGETFSWHNWRLAWELMLKPWEWSLPDETSLSIWNPQDGFGVCLFFFPPGDTEEEVSDDMKGNLVTFQSITRLSLPLVMHTCMNVTRIAHRWLTRCCATLKSKLGKQGLSACVGKWRVGVKWARVSAGRDGWAPGLVVFPSCIYKHHVFLLCKRIQRMGGLSQPLKARV